MAGNASERVTSNSTVADVNPDVLRNGGVAHGVRRAALDGDVFVRLILDSEDFDASHNRYIFAFARSLFTLIENSA